MKKIVVWGAGYDAEKFLSKNSECVEMVIDSDNNKIGNYIQGKPIINEDFIDDWSKYFVIIVTHKYEKEIAFHLEEIGLKRYEDFNTLNEYLLRYEIEDIKATIKEYLWGNNTKEETFFREISSVDEYQQVMSSSQIQKAVEYSKIVNILYSKRIGMVGYYTGYCSSCEKLVPLKVNFQLNDKYFNNRESFTCIKCGLNTRMRIVVDVAKSKFNRNALVYIYERVTKTYNNLKKVFPKIIGSEYLGDSYNSGDVINGILHEDAQSLSFGNESFDLIISNDVFEHVGDYMKAFKEAYRCLKKGGVLLFTIPFDINKSKTSVRAKVTRNGIKYMEKPVYHGNPIDEKGSLVFTDFGWDLLDHIRKIGFKDVKVTIAFSVSKGYLGGNLMYFEAIKGE